MQSFYFLKIRFLETLRVYTVEKMSGLLEGGHQEGQARAGVSASALCFCGLIPWQQICYLYPVLMGRPRVAASNGASVRR